VCGWCGEPAPVRFLRPPGAVAPIGGAGQGRNSDGIGGDPDSTIAIRTMLTVRTSSPFGLLDRLEQQLQTAERVPAAEVRESADTYEVVLELPGVDRDAIDVKATERTLVIIAERRSGHGEEPAGQGPLLSEFRYGTWSRSFRFPQAIERDQLQARYRDGLLTVTAPKAQKVSSVSVRVEA
jgi:HSP20 family protein